MAAEDEIRTIRREMAKAAREWAAALEVERTPAELEELLEIVRIGAQSALHAVSARRCAARDLADTLKQLESTRERCAKLNAPKSAESR